MVFIKKSWTRWFILMFILMVIYFLYKLYLEKENKQNEKSTFKITHGEKQFDYLQFL